MTLTRPVLYAIGALGTAIAVVGFAMTLKQAQGEDLTKVIGFEQRLGNQVPLDARFKDEAGREVTIGSLQSGRPTVLMLVFYRCIDVSGTCFLELEGAMKSFRSMQRDTIGKDFDVVTISIHPKETPDLAAAKKAQFLEQYGRKEAANGWHFLTGDLPQIQRVADSVGFKFRYDPVKDRVVHPAGLVLLTPNGAVSKYFYKTEYPSKYLRDSIVAAGRGEIGSREIPILLGCFVYDEATGKTRLHVKNALKVTGFATVILLAMSIALMTRRQRPAPEGQD